MNMKKFIACLVVMIVVFSSISVFADSAEGKTEKICVFTAELYYCDDTGGTVVLKSVTPMLESDETKALAKEIEYKETPLTKEGLRLADGTKAGQDWLNNYVDRKVRIILAVTDTGKMFIPYLAFI